MARPYEAPGWTEAEDQRLIELWREHHSFGEMAWEFPGRSRNACIGRVARLRKKLGPEMVPQGKSIKPAGAKRKRVRRRTPRYDVNKPFVPEKPPTEIKTPAQAPASRGVPLVELGPRDCRFIITDHKTREHLYCAAPAGWRADAFGNNCYCDYHFRIMRVHH